MAFIDWLRKQHEESERNTRLFQNRPGTLRAGEVPTHEMVAASEAWGGYQDSPGGQRLMVRQPIRRQSPPPSSVTLTEKDDGSRTKVTKWEPEKQLKVSAIKDDAVIGPGRELPPGRANPMWSAQPLDPSRWGGQRGLIENPMVAGMMASDPSWAGVPRPQSQTSSRAAELLLSPGPWVDAAKRMIPRRDQARVSGPMNTRPGTTGGSLRHPASIANIGMPRSAADSIGMPRVEDLRNRIAAIDRQQAAIPRQQMPPPRFVPPVDWRNFPQVQDRNTGTYTLPPGQVQMSGGFDWTGQALRENVGEDLRGVWNPIRDRLQKVLEDIRRRREGQTMAPFDWRNN